MRTVLEQIKQFYELQQSPGPKYLAIDVYMFLGVGRLASPYMQRQTNICSSTAQYSVWVCVCVRVRASLPASCLTIGSCFVSWSTEIKAGIARLSCICPRQYASSCFRRADSSAKALLIHSIATAPNKQVITLIRLHNRTLIPNQGGPDAKDTWGGAIVFAKPSWF